MSIITIKPTTKLILLHLQNMYQPVMNPRDHEITPGDIPSESSLETGINL